MAKKWLKNAIFGPKMLQMTYNLDVWCILMIEFFFLILLISKIFKFLPKIARFLGKKHPFFCGPGKNLGK